MHQRINRQVRLKSRPAGIPEAEHFEILAVPVPELGDGQVLVRNIYLSVDPAMRGWVNAAVAKTSANASSALPRKTHSASRATLRLHVTKEKG